MTITDFYQEFFNSDPYELFRAGDHEVAQVAEIAGFDWSANAASVRLIDGEGVQTKFRTYNRRYPITTDPRLKGHADIYSNIRSSGRIRYPFINFVVKQKGAGEWNGYDFLKREYDEHLRRSATVVTQTPEEIRRREERRQQQEARRLEREKQAAIEAKRREREAAEAREEWNRIKDAFDAAPREDGTHPYAIEKRIEPVFAHCDARRVTMCVRGHTGRKAEFMAIPLRHLNGENAGKLAGWQRIFMNGKKRQTAALEDVSYVGAAFVIGSLENAQRVAVAEGFATAASVFLADPGRFDAVVMAVSAGNILPVVRQLIELECGFEITCALDNDRSKPKKGNTGLLTGLEILEAFPDAGIKCIFPTFYDENGNDFNDLFVLNGRTETVSQMKAQANRLTRPANLYEAALQKLRFMSQENASLFEKQVFQCVDVAMLSCPAELSRDEVKAMIADRLKEMGADEAMTISAHNRIEWKYRLKKKAAMEARGFTDAITDPRFRPEHVDYRRLKTSRITPQVLDLVVRLSKTGPVIVRAGMGSGKTRNLMRPIMQRSHRGVALANRVSLMLSMNTVMQLDDDGNPRDSAVFYYKDDMGGISPELINKLTICINSIIKPKWQSLMNSHDFIGLDEATQGLRGILIGKAMENPVSVFNHLIDAFARTTDCALLVDADANDSLVSFCELAMQKRQRTGLPQWEKIHVIELPVDVTCDPDDGSEERQPLRVLYTDRDRVYYEIMAAAKREEKILIATDSKAFGQQVYDQLITDFPEKRWLYVSQDTKMQDDVKAFMSDPNGCVRSYDGLIYSPAISSGVSLDEHRHFTRHFGMFCGQIVPSDAIQMLRRDRKAREFLIGLAQLPGRKETSEDARRNGFAGAVSYTDFFLNHVTDIRLDPEARRASFGLADTDFTDMQFRLAAQEAAARNDFKNNLILILEADGYDVKQLAPSDPRSEAGKQMRKESRERVWEQTVLVHMEAETPSDEEREQLMEAEYLDVVQQAQLARWEIENELMLDVTPETLAFYMEGGRKKLSLLELMNMDDATAAAIDDHQAMICFSYSFRKVMRTNFVSITAHSREEADAKFRKLQPGVTSFTVRHQPLVEVPNRTFAALHSKALRLYFEKCGIDTKTGSGQATKEAQKEALTAVVELAGVDAFNNVLRFGGYLGRNGAKKRPDVVFKDICGALGFVVENDRIGARGARVMRLDADSVAFMNNLNALRAEAGKSFFNAKHEPVEMGGSDDPDLFLGLIDNERSGSLDCDIPASSNGASQNAAEATVAAAVADTPVPMLWVRSVLTSDEIKQLAAMPMQLARATLAEMYLADHIGSLKPGEHAALKRLQAS